MTAAAEVKKMASTFQTRRGILIGAAAVAATVPLGAQTLAQARNPQPVKPRVVRTVRGTILPGYEGVLEAFEENFASGLETGASFAVYRDGKPLVELWGGTAALEGAVPVTDRTLFTLHSASKGLAAICIAMLVDRGKLDYEAPVARYWPEFAANGKSAITVGQLMSHQAGLPTWRVGPITFDDLISHDKVAAKLAAQEPFFKPGLWAYHAWTMGTLSDELVRRTDGRTIHRFYEEEVRSKLDIDAFLGLPPTEVQRTALMVPTPGASASFDSPNPKIGAAPGRPVEGLLTDSAAQQRRAQASGFPAAWGTGSARALAQLYGSLVRRDGPLVSTRALEVATRPRVFGFDQSSGGLGGYSAGFRVNASGRHGANPASFGHEGAGGILGVADPTRRLGIGYTMNKMLSPVWSGPDPRTRNLLLALYAVEEMDRFKAEGAAA
ncbi:serine hydrolase domain-containing protein [Hydrogenophaga sp. BPS33]|uniref:serine hydrolase domain-containing protein n=1 Tax=Hydrogenophaga sp. BPS33 TaxID=2651974 RepID=UPI001358314F|nr:serine hydrolase domain-containing protein [Hydrogenophaga sp. BPS33]